MKKINKRGFTLVELLVVIAIIGILAGIVFVSMNSAREKSRKASLQGTLSSIVPTAMMCVNDGYYVGSATAGQPICYTDAALTTPSTEITETWPTLPANISANYGYGTDGTLITGTKDGAVIITCTIATGSCQ